MQLRRISVAILTIITILPLYSQFNTYSPYTRFGLGDLSKNGFGQNLAMGGTGIAVHESNRINYLNPAASSALDSTSVYFDFGINGFYNQYQYNNPVDPNGDPVSNNWGNVNFHHVAFGSSMGKHMGVMAGIVPFSSIGYNIKQELDDFSTGTALDTYHQGDGGIMNFFLGTSVEMLDRVSLGVTMNYLMGKLTRERAVDFPMNPNNYSSTSSREDFDLRSVLFSTGLQYMEVFDDKFFFTVGATYDFKTNMRADLIYDVSNAVYGGEDSRDIEIDSLTSVNPYYVLSTDTLDGDFVMPSKLGLGFSVGIPDKLLVTGDYYIQDWTGAMGNDHFQTTASSSFHLGAEYTPDKEAIRGYHKLVTYRIGGYYSDSYLSVLKPLPSNVSGGDYYQISDYGITFGVGLPIRTLKSSMNVAFTLGTRGTTEYNLVKENYGIITFNVTLHDLWFRKRKFD